MNKRIFALLGGVLFLFPSALRAVVLDDFFQSSTITAVTDSGSSLTNTLVSGPSGLALQMDYSLGTGNYVVALLDVSTQNFAAVGGNAVRFKYKASGQSNTVEIKFTDSDSTASLRSDKLSYKFLTVPDSQWRTFTIYFSSFALFPDGNSSFDLSRVSRIAVGLTTDNSSRGSGTLWVDKMELYKSTFTLIDNFQDAAEPNFFGGTNLNTGTSGGATASASYAALGSDKVLQYTWDNTPASSFSFMFLNLQKNFQGYTHLSFRVRGNAGGEWVKMKLESAPGNSPELFISTYLAGGITTAFQRVEIPLTAFSGVSFSTINVLTIVTTNASGAGSGTVWFDDIAFARAGENPEAIRALDEFDTDPNLTNWETYTHADGSLSRSAVSDASVPGAGAGNRVYKIDYSFTTNPASPGETAYAVIERPLQVSMAPVTGIKFKYKGTGTSNNLEIKLTDFDGTTWFKKLLSFTNTGGVWKQTNVPFSQFSLFSSGDDGQLNLKYIKRLEFAISRGSGGNGSFTLDTIETPETGEFEQALPGHLISAVSLVNNPFTPNGDGIKDQIFFNYSLEAASKATLKIFTLRGDDIKTVIRSDQNAGDQSVSWDGTDNSGVKVANGLYVCVLEAESVDGRKDYFRHVVGALR